MTMAGGHPHRTPGEVPARFTGHAQWQGRATPLTPAVSRLRLFGPIALYLVVAYAIVAALTAQRDGRDVVPMLVGASLSAMVPYSILTAVLHRRGHLRLAEEAGRLWMRSRSHGIGFAVTTTVTRVAVIKRDVGTDRAGKTAWEHWLILEAADEGTTMTFGVRDWGKHRPNVKEGVAPMYACDLATLGALANVFGVSLPRD